jgi:hypothetical protein
MNEASEWRLALARKILPAYTASPNVEVVIVAGSVGRGCADRYSDIELDIFYSRPPTDDERLKIIADTGGKLDTIWPYEEDEWSEVYTVGGVKCEISGFLSATMDRYLAAIVDRFETTWEKQVLLYAVQNSVVLHGQSRVEQWRAKAAVYPEALARAMINAQLDLSYLWYVGEMLAARDDALMLYDVFCAVEKRILCLLLGLNRVYQAHPRHKWMDLLITDELPVAPRELSARLKQVFRVPLSDGVCLLKQLATETHALVKQRYPDIELPDLFGGERASFDAPPPDLIRL